MRGVLAIVGAVLAGVGLGQCAPRALAHDWYPVECCSQQDCKPIDDPREVGESGDRYTYRGLSFSKAQTKTSPDGKYHVCVVQAHGSGASHIRCMWKPFQGS